MVTLILFVLIFGVVVISHEFGHFLLAKANGIHVIEFSVGMGPNLFSFQKGDTKYSLKLLPIGGACMFEGEDGLNEKEDGEDHSGSFLNANVWARMLEQSSWWRLRSLAERGSKGILWCGGSMSWSTARG